MPAPSCAAPRRALLPALVLAAMLPALGGCAVVAVTSTVVGAGIAVASTAVDATVAVGKGVVKVGGAIIP